MALQPNLVSNSLSLVHPKPLTYKNLTISHTPVVKSQPEPMNLVPELAICSPTVCNKLKETTSGQIIGSIPAREMDLKCDKKLITFPKQTSIQLSNPTSSPESLSSGSYNVDINNSKFPQMDPDDCYHFQATILDPVLLRDIELIDQGDLTHPAVSTESSIEGKFSLEEILAAAGTPPEPRPK